MRLIQGAFEQHCDAIVSEIKTRGRSERALFVLDQYGFKDVPMPLIRSIFERLDKPEVILTFGIDSLLTYLTDSPSSRATLQRLGLDRYVDWPNLTRMKEAGRFKELLQRQLSLGLLEQSGARFITLFFVRPLGSNSWDYWLVHLSRSYRARDVMMRVHWSLGNQFMHAMEPGLFQLGYAPAADPLASGQYDLPLGSPYSFDHVLRDAARKELALVLPREAAHPVRRARCPRCQSHGGDRGRPEGGLESRHRVPRACRGGTKRRAADQGIDHQDTRPDQSQPAAPTVSADGAIGADRRRLGAAATSAVGRGTGRRLVAVGLHLTLHIALHCALTLPLPSL
jgi:hypothetical protein